MPSREISNCVSANGGLSDSGDPGFQCGAAASMNPDEIVENEFNLNIPRYVDTFEPEEEIDVAALQKDINDIEDELAAVRTRMAGI